MAEGHHERLDGSGHPHRLSGAGVPIVARIIAVADIFDALTSRRPYKEPWNNKDALRYLHRQADRKLDRDCVEALLQNPDEILQIQAAFQG